ncbi:MAG: N-acetylglucosamine kinase [Runella sp.]
MKLIADSGATKTDWRIIATDGSIHQAKTIGLSPYYQDSESIATELTQHLKPHVTENVTEIYFYGTGCAGEEPCAIVRRGLQAVFPSASPIEVESDMLGAARGLCGREPGIACILGTGSNNCLYDGRQIADKIPSLGFWLGDEGSGGYLGKTLVVSFLHKEMPEDLAEKFGKRYALTREVVLENAYKKPFPNRYFAGFSKFLFDHRSHPFAYRLVFDAFTLFLQKYVCKFAQSKDLKVHFTGSVAFYYSDILRRAAGELGLTVGIIMETPIAGLTLYHQK